MGSHSASRPGAPDVAGEARRHGGAGAGRPDDRGADRLRPVAREGFVNAAEWTNGKRRLSGRWEYVWHTDRFHIVLDRKDRITGFRRELLVAAEHPEWGRWKLVRR